MYIIVLFVLSSVVSFFVFVWFSLDEEGKGRGPTPVGICSECGERLPDEKEVSKYTDENIWNVYRKVVRACDNCVQKSVRKSKVEDLSERGDRSENSKDSDGYDWNAGERGFNSMP